MAEGILPQVWISKVFPGIDRPKVSPGIDRPELDTLHWILVLFIEAFIKVFSKSNPNYKYVLSERGLWTMIFDTSTIKIGWEMGKIWAFKKFNMANM